MLFRSHPCAELACCVRRPPRVVIVVPTPPRVVIVVVRHPPRVAIVVQARGSTSSSSHCRGANRGFSRLGWSAEPTLLSLSWYKPWCQTLLVSLTWFKPRERLSLANRWMCQYPYGKNTDVSRGKNRGESNVYQLGVDPDPVVIHVSQLEDGGSYRLRRVSVLWSAPSSSRYRGVNPADKIPYRGVNPAHKIPHRVVIVGFGTLLVSLSWCQPLLVSLSWCQSSA